MQQTTWYCSTGPRTQRPPPGAVSQLRQGTSGTPSLARIQGVCPAVRAARSRGSERQQQQTASSCSKDLCSTGSCSRQPDLAARARAHKDNPLRSHRSRADLSRDRWIQSPECWPLHHETNWTHSAAPYNRHTTSTPLCLAASVAGSQLRQGTIGTTSLAIRHGFCPAAAPSPPCLAASGAVSQLRQGTSGTPSLAIIQGVCPAARAGRSRGGERQQQQTVSPCSKDLCSTCSCSRQPGIAA